MNTPRYQARVAVLVVCVVVAMTAIAATKDPTIENQLSDTEAMFQQARIDNWDLYAPKTFEEARKNLDKALEKFRKGGEIDQIRKELDKARTSLAAAERHVEIGAVVMTDAITARSDALAAGAPDHAADQWKDAKQTMHDAGRSVEQGDSNDARKKASKAEGEFRKSELTAIRISLLGAAGQARDAALAADAEKKSPQTYAEGVKALEAAESTLKGDRYQRGEAKDHAKAAADAFKHATYIAGLVDRVEADKPERFEDQQRQHEAVLTEAATTLNMRVDFSEGIPTAGAAILAGIQSLQADRNNLRDELNMTATRADSLRLALMEVQETKQSVTATMRTEQYRQQNIRELEGLFTSDQASVIRQGDEVICRVYGLSFPVGSSEIQPQNFELLTRIQRALRIFPEAAVVVEGHTDAAGDDDLNQRLSQERADAVRQYIVANMPNSAMRITTKGYGESSPLTSNDSLDGRAKNRRIDIRLTDLYGVDVSLR
jgi:outer membrane protein OmpA-like peptidoglycan-associated protein